MTKDSQTIAVYDEQAKTYSDFTSTAINSDPNLIRFMKRVCDGGTVLDLGCGPGDHAVAMQQAGFSVTALDPSSAMTEMASRHAGLTVRQAGFEDVTETNAYDGVWANFSLLHSLRAEFPGHLRRIAGALKPGGVLHLGMKEGTGERRDHLGRHYAYYLSEELHTLLGEAGLVVVHEAGGSGPGLAGDIEPWLFLIAENHKS